MVLEGYFRRTNGHSKKELILWRWLVAMEAMNSENSQRLTRASLGMKGMPLSSITSHFPALVDSTCRITPLFLRLFKYVQSQILNEA